MKIVRSQTRFDFLSAPGELAERFGAHDWSATPVGPLENWPQSLRTTIGLMLGSRHAMCLAWGPDLTFFYNDAYAPFLGERHPDALGRPIREVWSEVWSDIRPLLERALSGEATWSEDLHLVMLRNGHPEDTWWSFSYSPVRDESGRVAGVLDVCSDSTEMVLTRRRQAFLLDFSDRLRGVADPLDVVGIAARALGRHLKVARVGYADIVDDRLVKVERDWTDGRVASLGGEVRPLDGFGPDVVAGLRAGRTLRLDDVGADPRSAPHAGAYAGIGARSLLLAPLVRDGRLTAVLYAHEPEPRLWTGEDVMLLEDVAARTWEAVVRGRAETARRESEARFRTAADSSPALMWMTDEQGEIVFVNARFKAFFGIEPEEMLAGGWRRIVHPDDIDGFEGAFRTAFATREPFHRRIRVLHPKLGIRWLSCDGGTRHGAGDEFLGYVGANVDVTEAVLAEQALRDVNETLERQVAERTAELEASRARLRAVFETSYAFQGLVAPDGTLLDANATALSSIRAERDEVLGRPFWDTPWFSGTPGLPDIVREAFLVALRGETAHREVVVRLPSGWRSFDFSMRPIYDQQGAVTAIVPEAIDLTERRQAEEALKQSQKLEAMGQLTGGVAHDFNNLLTPIVGSLDMLQRRGIGDARTQRLVDGALQSAERAKILVQRLLAFARRQPLQTSAVDLASLVAGMADLVASTTGPQIRVVVDIAPGLPTAVADPNQLEMAILNLSMNARDAMPEGGTLRISAEPRSVPPGNPAKLAPGDYVRLSVADSGTGMDEATRARAVEPFFSTKGIGKGTGLGLSMAHGLASQLGGALTISSRVGLGTNVELWLPAGTEAALRADAAADPASPPRAAGRVLLVDDEEFVRASTADMLEDLGYDVVQAASAEEALRLLDRGVEADLLVTDHLMPGMTGRDLAVEVRARRPGMGVLIVSGFAEVEGIDPDLPLLTKPFRQVDLAAGISALKPAGS